MMSSHNSTPNSQSPFSQLIILQHRRVLSNNKNQLTQLQFDKLKFKQCIRTSSHKKLTLTQNQHQKSTPQQHHHIHQQPSKHTNIYTNQPLNHQNKTNYHDQNNPEFRDNQIYQFYKEFYQKISFFIQKLNQQNHQQKLIIDKLITSLKSNEQKLIKCQKQLKYYLTIIRNEHIQTKINDLQIKINILSTTSQFNQNTINQKIHHLQTSTIRFFLNKLHHLKNIVYQYINSKQNKLKQIQQNIKSFNLHKLQRIQYLYHKVISIKQKLDSTQQVPTKDSITQLNNLSQFSFSNSRQTFDVNNSISEDYFFYPSSIDSNTKMKAVLQVLTCRTYPLNCYIDSAGYVRYSDSATYLFDRKGNFINLQDHQIKYLESRKLIILNKQKKK